MKITLIIDNLFKQLRKRRKVKIRISPDKLPPDIMAKVMKEVEFLRSNHAVDVQELDAGEVPTIPSEAEK